MEKPPQNSTIPPPKKQGQETHQPALKHHKTRAQISNQTRRNHQIPTKHKAIELNGHTRIKETTKASEHGLRGARLREREKKQLDLTKKNSPSNRASKYLPNLNIFFKKCKGFFFPFPKSISYRLGISPRCKES